MSGTCEDAPGILKDRPGFVERTAQRPPLLLQGPGFLSSRTSQPAGSVTAGGATTRLSGIDSAQN
ncbi:MAG: hypothetical protein ACF8TS_13400 [Maioricimonas sp. JB049]